MAKFLHLIKVKPMPALSNFYKAYIFAFLLTLALPSCKPPIKSEALYGKWKYIKVEHPNATPPDSLTEEELKANTPYIDLEKPDTLQINWGGRTLSHGTFRLDGSNIWYQETLGNGKKRQFPFIVSKLTAKEIVFETQGDAGSRVTAVR